MRLRRSGLRLSIRRPAVMSQTYCRLIPSSSAKTFCDIPDLLMAFASESLSIAPTGTHCTAYYCVWEGGTHFSASPCSLTCGFAELHRRNCVPLRGFLGLRYAEFRRTMRPVTPEEWLTKVGVHIRDRRRDLKIRSMRLAALDAGVSESTWRQAETGRRQTNDGRWVAPNPSSESRALICRRLYWTDDSIDRMARGEPPEIRSDLLDAESVPGSDISDYNDALDAELDYVLSSLSIENRAKVLGIGKRLLDEEMAALPWIGSDEPPEWHVRLRRELGLHPARFKMSEDEAMAPYRTPKQEQFAQAADGGLPVDEGPEQHRPSPEPEP